ncbi:hypothetical protein Tsubulata_051335 [Turnera subulata]|uniref:MADS-box domain-containing protein n=1 Tax=Turnera subulata TaxID=218843 RepID=A0A9Q0J994_9ROSI|nr:hypothetical protein Tsubulata_051335 [Turnera subulata]
MEGKRMASQSRGKGGRKKLELVKIPKASNLMVTFSKRKSGLFKKASELATLCGAEVGIILFSPGRKVFSFGHPSVEQVVDRFLSGTTRKTSGAIQLLEAHRSVMIRDLNMELTRVQEDLEMEKRRGEDLQRLCRAGQFRHWWQRPVEDLDLQQLEELQGALQQLKAQAGKQAEKVLFQSGNISGSSFGSSSNGPVFPYNPNNTVFNPNMDPASSSGAVVPYNPGNGGFNTDMGPNYRYYPGHGNAML